jgi:hypothetical protein
MPASVERDQALNFSLTLTLTTMTKRKIIKGAFRLAAQCLKYSGPERRKRPDVSGMFDRRKRKYK